MEFIKGVVLEKENNEAVVLTPDGQFKRVRVAGSFEVGEEVAAPEVLKNKQKSRRQWLYGFAMAASLVLALLIPGVINNFTVPETMDTAYYDSGRSGVVASVQVDINPSLQLDVDGQSMVIEAKALNEDGIEVLKQGEVKGLMVNEAIEKITEWSYSLGYLGLEKGNVVKLTYKYHEDQEKLVTEMNLMVELEEKVQGVLKSKGLDGEVKSYYKNFNRGQGEPNQKKLPSNKADVENHKNSKDNTPQNSKKGFDGLKDNYSAEPNRAKKDHEGNNANDEVKANLSGSRSKTESKNLGERQQNTGNPSAVEVKGQNQGDPSEAKQEKYLGNQSALNEEKEADDGLTENKKNDDEAKNREKGTNEKSESQR